MAVCFFLANNSDASLVLKLKSNKDTREEKTQTCVEKCQREASKSE